MSLEIQRIFSDLHRICLNGIKSGLKNVGRDWLMERNLRYEKTHAVFNSGQIVHKRNQRLIGDLLSIGFITPSLRPQNANRKSAYSVFAKHAVMFPLFDENHNVVNYFAVTLKDNKQHLLNDQGIYPAYPAPSTKVLYITPFLDAATLLETNALQNREACIAIHTDELAPRHVNVIQELKYLEQVIVVDSIRRDIAPCIQAVTSAPVQVIALPERLSLLELHMEGKNIKTVIHGHQYSEDTFHKDTPAHPPIPNRHMLDVVHENKLAYRTADIQYFVVGSISQDLANLTIMLIAEDSTGRKERIKVDLYDHSQVSMVSETLASAFDRDSETIRTALVILTDLLEHHRDAQLEASPAPFTHTRTPVVLSPESRKACVEFLSQPNLMRAIDGVIERSGVVGETATRLLMFVIASTYTSPEPLHCIIQAKSGNGKSHLANAIGKLIPQESVLSLSRISGKSLYHYTSDELVDKVIIIQDFDGIHPEAVYAFRELQSAGCITSSLTHKDKNGNLVSSIKTVRGRFSSLACTTKDVYEDNQSRSILIGLDEGPEQTHRIVSYQNKKLAGSINVHEEHEAQIFLQNCLRALKPYTVINRYADKISLPIEARSLRRLNTQFQNFTQQITILNQYQRQTDEHGRLIVTPEDITCACNLLFDTLMVKIDDLDDPSLRFFFERLKVFATDQPTFSQREVRLALHVSKTQCFRFFNDLVALEYIQRVGGRENRGFKYKIVYHDDTQKLRERIKKDLAQQLERLE